MRRLLAILLALILWMAPAGDVSARQDDPRLETLFEALQDLNRPSQREVRAIEVQIWMIWSESGSETIDLLFASGIQAMRDGRLADAVNVFGEIIVLDPGFAESWNKRATVHFVLGNYPESIADVERTLALEPRHFGALAGLGQIYMRLERPEDALAAMREGLEVHPHMKAVRDAAEGLRKVIEGDSI